MPRPLTQDTSPLPPALSTTDAPLPPSTCQRTRDASAFLALRGQLVALSAAQLAWRDLPEVLHEAVVAAQRMRALSAGLQHSPPAPPARCSGSLRAPLPQTPSGAISSSVRPAVSGKHRATSSAPSSARLARARIAIQWDATTP
jgi:hypothetical protein